MIIELDPKARQGERRRILTIARAHLSYVPMSVPSVHLPYFGRWSTNPFTWISPLPSGSMHDTRYAPDTIHHLASYGSPTWSYLFFFHHTVFFLTLPLGNADVHIFKKQECKRHPNASTATQTRRRSGINSQPSHSSVLTPRLDVMQASVTRLHRAYTAPLTYNKAHAESVNTYSGGTIALLCIVTLSFNRHG